MTLKEELLKFFKAWLFGLGLLAGIALVSGLAVIPIWVGHELLGKTGAMLGGLLNLSVFAACFMREIFFD